MKKVLTMVLMGFLSLAFSASAIAQAVTGTVKDADGEALIGVSVTVDGTYIGTTTDVSGNFSLNPDFSKGTVSLVFSYVGYKSQKVEVTAGQSGINVTLEESTFMADEVIVSASRVEERIMETPVTVESVGIKQLQTQASTELFSSLGRYKGIDVNQSSLLISVLSTRGFNSAKSERVIQMIDGLDYQSPSLNLYAGNTGGIPEVDIESVDIIYGANSALYGANAFNGVIITNSKDPFKYPGLTVAVRGGERSLFETQVRFAAKVTDRFAVKLVGSYLTANDFVGENLTPRNSQIVPGNNPEGDNRNWDAVHRHGETAVANAGTAIGGGATLGDLGFEGSLFLPGFSEQDLVGDNYKATNNRFAASLHYLITDKIQASYKYQIGTGGGLYQSSNRYAWNRLEFNYHMAEVKSDKWFVRWYRNEDKPGDTYDLNFLGLAMAADQLYQAPSGSQNPFPEGTTYASAYAQTYIGGFAAARQGGQTVEQAYATANAAAANVIPTAGDSRFAPLRANALAGQGLTGNFDPRFNNNSNFNDFSAQYELPIEAVKILVGGNYRRFRLTSGGTLFGDGDASPLQTDGNRDLRTEINNDQWGIYAQFNKAFIEDRLKLSFAARLDGYQNFDARFSPRASVVYSAGADRQHNFRASYAIAYRQPTNVDQYIYLDIGSLLLIGNIGENPAGGFNAIPLSAAAGGDATPFFIRPLDLERMNSWEVGYKGILFDGFYVDASYYRSSYQDFIGTQRFFGRETGETPDLNEVFSPDPNDPNRTRAMQVWLNADQEVTSQGFQIGVEYYIAKPFNIVTNYTWSSIEEVENLILGFNTPEHKFNFGINGEPVKNFTYNVNLRTQSSYEYFMPFDENTIESFSTVDLQLTYKVPKIYTTFRAGGTNLFDAEAIQVWGSAPIGRILYVGATFDMNIFKQ